jgi:hypothetical protein
MAAADRLNVGSVVPMWHVAINGDLETMQLLMEKYGSNEEFRVNSKKAAQDGTTPLTMAVVKGYSKLLPLFENLYGDGLSVVQECLKLGRPDLVSPDMLERANLVDPERLSSLMEAAVVSDTDASVDFIRQRISEGRAQRRRQWSCCCLPSCPPPDLLADLEALLLKRSSQASANSLEVSPLIALSRRFPVFNTKVESNWSTEWRLPGSRRFVSIQSELTPHVLKGFCCLRSSATTMMVCGMLLQSCTPECQQ